MQPWPVLSDPGGRAGGWAGLRWASLVLISCWTVGAAALSAWVFHAWAAPLPALSPNDGPIPTGPDTNLSFLAGGAAMAVLLAAFTVAVAVTGAAYLARVRPAGRAGTAWVSAVTAAAAAEVMLTGAFVDPGSPLGMAPGRVNWGLLVLAAFFAALGSSMISIIIAAARRARLLPAAR